MARTPRMVSQAPLGRRWEYQSQPGSDAIHSFGSAPTALSHQIKDQIPSSAPKTGALLAPLNILRKKQWQQSHLYPRSSHISLVLVALHEFYLQLIFKWGDGGMRETANSKDVEPSEKADHLCFMQEIQTPRTNSSGLRYPQPSRSTHNHPGVHTTLFFSVHQEKLCCTRYQHILPFNIYHTHDTAPTMAESSLIQKSSTHSLLLQNK